MYVTLLRSILFTCFNFVVDLVLPRRWLDTVWHAYNYSRPRPIVSLTFQILS